MVMVQYGNALEPQRFWTVKFKEVLDPLDKIEERPFRHLTEAEYNRWEKIGSPAEACLGDIADQFHQAQFYKNPVVKEKFQWIKGYYAIIREGPWIPAGTPVKRSSDHMYFVEAATLKAIGIGPVDVHDAVYYGCRVHVSNVTEGEIEKSNNSKTGS